MKKLPLSKQALQEITKNYPGIRYKINKDGKFMIYVNTWTLIIDSVKWLIKKIKKI